MPARESSKKVLAKGFFQDAEVVRGHDWLWGDQDGEKTTYNLVLVFSMFVIFLLLNMQAVWATQV